ncbi:hypothetical protein M426DRAFT_148053 [Hypoxylon sp. CI-4A]|nr:hypothetical protein M426DRAFT_148053 [Hypoxylon sp. CI-4A]
MKWHPFGKGLSVMPLSKVRLILLMPLSKWVWKYRASAGSVISYCLSVCSSLVGSVPISNKETLKTPLDEKN